MTDGGFMRAPNMHKLLTFAFLFGLFAVTLARAEDLKVIKEQSYSSKKYELLKVESDMGDVYVKSWDKDEVAVRVKGNERAKDKLVISISKTGGGVLISVRRDQGFFSKLFNWNSVRCRIEVLVPAQYNLEMYTAGGDYVVGMVTGEMKLNTSGGDIKLKNCGGSLNAKTSGGEIVVEQFKGDVRVSTSGGDVNISESVGNVYAATSGGDVSVQSASGRVEAKTSGGDIELDYHGPNKGIDCATAGGDISVNIPSDLSAYTKLSTVGGSVSLNNVHLTKTKTKSSSRFEGDFNGGGEVLRCSTVGGDITITAK